MKIVSKKSKWARFLDKDYVLEDLGRPAIFLLPAKRLQTKIGKLSIEGDLHKFLIKNFGAYTSSMIPNFGFWKDARKATISDACLEYEVSFLGKGKIPLLIKKLADVASIIKEDCIYFKAGQYSCLIYPRK